MRHRDVHLLTVGRYTYTSDQRFRAIHQPHSEDWTLQLKYPQHRDSGVYECQISSTPHISHFIHLTVIGIYFISFMNDTILNICYYYKQTIKFIYQFRTFTASRLLTFGIIHTSIKQSNVAGRAWRRNITDKCDM